MSTKHRTTPKVIATLQEMSGKSLSLGNLLWAIRSGEEMTQIEFSNLLKISRQYLCDLEHGRRFASPKAASDYATKLGYSPAQFVKLALQDLLDKDHIKLLVEVKEAA